MTAAVSLEGAPNPSRAKSAGSIRKIRWAMVLPLAAFVLVAVVGPLVLPFDPTRAVAGPSIPPGGEHWFGTDRSGLDVFSRTISATRLNIIIAGSITLTATIGGCLLGILLGMNESRPGVLGIIAKGTSRLIDLVQAVPAILLGLVAVAFFGKNEVVIVITIAILSLPNQARLVRSETLRIRSEAYLDAARMAGTSEGRILWKHVLPNAIGPAISNMSVIFALAIITTAGLGFVGAGVQPPTPEWGSMLSIGAADAQAGRWWSALFPALFLALCVAAVSMANSAFSHARRR